MANGDTIPSSEGKEEPMKAYQALRVAAKQSRVPLIEIGPRLGKNRSYVSTLISKGSTPRCDTLAAMAGAIGWELCLVPKGKAPKSALKLD